MRPLTKLLPLALLLFVGCGGPQNQETRTEPTSPPIPQTSARLTIVDQNGKVNQLICPSADQRCSRIKAEDFRPKTKQVCLQVYGGPERAEIKGTINGEKVSLVLSRTDSCKVAQWGELSWILNP